MNILGINYIFHDSSACLIQDGAIAFAVEEERLSRQKHSQSFPFLAIHETLQRTGLGPDDIDHVAVSINPGKADNQKLAFASGLGGQNGRFLDYEFERLQQRNLAFWDWYYGVWPQGKLQPEVHFVDHHLAHAAGTYFVSPWNSAALLSIDGWGEWATTWAGSADGNNIKKLGESLFPHSLGVFYSAATQFCGFIPNYDEGKTMGLAPCGDPSRFFDTVDSMVRVDENLAVEIDLDWFDFPKLGAQLFNEKFIEKFGLPRQDGQEIEDHHTDVAAAFQAVLENKVLKIARQLREKTNEKRLVYAGGVALNSVVNGRILEEGIFEDVFLMPGAGDNGTSIGAAAYVHSKILKQDNRIVHKSPYLGYQYTDSDIEEALKAAKIPYSKANDIYEDVAQALFQGQIIGWFQGRMEFGPRALGARSILADPTKPEMKEKINAEVKHREPFRPFAPSVIRERSNDYFDIDVEVPYMLKVASVRPEMRDKVPAIVHVDGTARVQTVNADIAPEYHRVISRLGELTGHPIVLNTSFNVMGEPIVESPRDALRCFFSTGLDVLAIGSFIIRKSEASKSIQIPIAAQ